MENAIKVIYSQIITRIEDGLEVIDHLNRSCLLFFFWGGGECVNAMLLRKELKQYEEEFS